MAKAKKGAKKGKSGAKRKAAKRTSARKARGSARARTARSGGSDKRVAQLEAENRRLRDEIAALRAEREEPPAAREGEPEGQPTLDL